MRACFWAIVKPGFAFLIGLLLCGVCVGVPLFVGTVVWFGRGEGVGPEGRFFGRVGAMLCRLFCDGSGAWVEGIRGRRGSGGARVGVEA